MAALRHAKLKALGIKPKPLTEEHKQKMRQAGAAWYSLNRERIRQKRAERPKTPRGPSKPPTDEHRARRKKSSAEHYQKNKEIRKERRKESTKAWRERNPARNKANYAAWALQNRSKRNKDHCEWMAAHPEVRRMFQMKRRALEKAADVGHSEIIKQWEMKWRTAARVRCFWCQNFFAGKKMHLDHIVAYQQGGKHSIENVCASCGPCNNKKKDKTVEA